MSHHPCKNIGPHYLKTREGRQRTFKKGSKPGREVGGLCLPFGMLFHLRFQRVCHILTFPSAGGYGRLQMVGGSSQCAHCVKKTTCPWRKGWSLQYPPDYTWARMTVSKGRELYHTSTWGICFYCHCYFLLVPLARAQMEFPKEVQMFWTFSSLHSEATQSIPCSPGLQSAPPFSTDIHTPPAQILCVNWSVRYLPSQSFVFHMRAHPEMVKSKLTWWSNCLCHSDRECFLLMKPCLQLTRWSSPGHSKWRVKHAHCACA